MGAQKHCRRAGNGPALREEALPLQPQAVCRERSKQAASCHIKVASRRNLMVKSPGRLACILGPTLQEGEKCYRPHAPRYEKCGMTEGWMERPGKEGSEAAMQPGRLRERRPRRPRKTIMQNRSRPRKQEKMNPRRPKEKRPRRPRRRRT